MDDRSESGTHEEYEALRAEAIRAMTRAARFSWSNDSPMDFGEFVTQVVTATAANIGTLSKLLAGRPGSWEADLVRQMVVGAAGPDGDHLPEHRTDPVVVDVDVEEIMWESGVEEEFDQAAHQARQAVMDAAEDGTSGTVDDRAREAADDVWNRLEEKKRLYAERLEAEILKAAQEQGYRAPVTVRINPRDANLHEYGTVERALLDIARDRTDLPTVD
ncbi:hypothetical protein ATJ97_0201 [Georgenia soli]|uniref:Uncharacterized protein n=1 Tax=Georgenia soli TaxID=638953 RepID=A0A2A9F0K6_9MICO|nr:hypothetical protein [Georgenia soli]PFG44927.1 hypothetical protein ATJ97_0201 [Georgenia soli]